MNGISEMLGLMSGDVNPTAGRDTVCFGGFEMVA